MYPLRMSLVLYRLCADWHSGQSSRGYRLLCRLSKRLERHGINPEFAWSLTRMELVKVSTLGRKWGEKL